MSKKYRGRVINNRGRIVNGLPQLLALAPILPQLFLKIGAEFRPMFTGVKCDSAPIGNIITPLIEIGIFNIRK